MTGDDDDVPRPHIWQFSPKNNLESHPKLSWKLIHIWRHLWGGGVGGHQSWVTLQIGWRHFWMAPYKSIMTLSCLLTFLPSLLLFLFSLIFIGSLLLTEFYRVFHNECTDKYCVRQRGWSLGHSACTPPSVHPGMTIWGVKSIFFSFW